MSVLSTTAESITASNKSAPKLKMHSTHLGAYQPTSGYFWNGRLTCVKFKLLGRLNPNPNKPEGVENTSPECARSHASAFWHTAKLCSGVSLWLIGDGGTSLHSRQVRTVLPLDLL